eukprot:CAMPEP_0205814484 /NCGR_PEP_ID=MMETSP0205-20121125/19672_1 /ASSEMBLY_ACC=CAM_ASM_000278 /TAXON_ID=36767 /ORGANISM="Euplotes focardii, Strain TN1" /LENGTH=87 /DNA_ID=CAMNT_0053098677 /DNA_START=20 /DNA_END=283 /DNA_ORIENTATION=-
MPELERDEDNQNVATQRRASLPVNDRKESNLKEVKQSINDHNKKLYRYRDIRNLSMDNFFQEKRSKVKPSHNQSANLEDIFKESHEK